MTKNIFDNVYKILTSSSKINRALNIRIANVINAIYGVEKLIMNKQSESMPEILEMWINRRIGCISWKRTQ